MSGLIPQPYRKDGDIDVYRVPVHFRRGGTLCSFGGQDAQPGELDRCPYHGEIENPLCEVNPDHLMHGVPAVVHVARTGDNAVPACQDCATGVLLGNRMLA